MPLPITDEHRLIQNLSKELAEKEVAPFAMKADHEGIYPAEVIQK